MNKNKSQVTCWDDQAGGLAKSVSTLFLQMQQSLAEALMEFWHEQVQ